MSALHVDQQEFDACAQDALRVNGLLLLVQDALRRGDMAGAMQPLTEARDINWNSEKRLVRLGASDPIDAHFAHLERELPLAEALALPLAVQKRE